MPPKTKTTTEATGPDVGAEAAQTERLYRTNDDVGLLHDSAFRGVFYGYLDGADHKGQALALVSVVALGAQPAGKRVREFPVAVLRPVLVATKTGANK